jgi:hypothetical protein
MATSAATPRAWFALKLERVGPVILRLGLHLRPESRQLTIELTDFRTQHHEIVGRAEAPVGQEIQGAFATRGRESRLQCEHLAHRHRESARN